MRQLALAVVNEVQNGSVQFGKALPVEISAPHNKCTAMRCTNRSMWFGTISRNLSEVLRKFQTGEGVICVSKVLWVNVNNAAISSHFSQKGLFPMVIIKVPVHVRSKRPAQRPLLCLMAPWKGSATLKWNQTLIHFINCTCVYGQLLTNLAELCSYFPNVQKKLLNPTPRGIFNKIASIYRRKVKLNIDTLCFILLLHLMKWLSRLITDLRLYEERFAPLWAGLKHKEGAFPRLLRRNIGGDIKVLKCGSNIWQVASERNRHDQCSVLIFPISKSEQTQGQESPLKVGKWWNPHHIDTDRGCICYTVERKKGCSIDISMLTGRENKKGGKEKFKGKTDAHTLID